MKKVSKIQHQRFVPYMNGGGYWINCGKDKFTRCENHKRRRIQTDLVDNITYVIDFSGNRIDEISI